MAFLGSFGKFFTKGPGVVFFPMAATIAATEAAVKFGKVSPQQLLTASIQPTISAARSLAGVGVPRVPSTPVQEYRIAIAGGPAYYAPAGGSYLEPGGNPWQTETYGSWQMAYPEYPGTPVGEPTWGETGYQGSLLQKLQALSPG